jgi:hypothetical protein
MYRDFVHTTGHIHAHRLHEMENRAQREADRREARAAKSIRRAMGQRLIAIGERMAEHPSPRSSLAKAA